MRAYPKSGAALRRDANVPTTESKAMPTSSPSPASGHTRRPSAKPLRTRLVRYPSIHHGAIKPGNARQKPLQDCKREQPTVIHAPKQTQPFRVAQHPPWSGKEKPAHAPVWYTGAFAVPGSAGFAAHTPCITADLLLVSIE